MTWGACALNKMIDDWNLYGTDHSMRWSWDVGRRHHRFLVEHHNMLGFFSKILRDTDEFKSKSDTLIYINKSFKFQSEDWLEKQTWNWKNSVILDCNYCSQQGHPPVPVIWTTDDRWLNLAEDYGNILQVESIKEFLRNWKVKSIIKWTLLVNGFPPDKLIIN